MQEVATFGREVTLVQEPGILEEGAKLSSEQAYLARLALSQVKILALLPIAKIALTETEQQAARTYQLAHLILGPAAAAPMLCSKKCPDPFRIVCPLAKVGKEPIGQRCPFEQQYVAERFLAWMNDLGRTLDDLLEMERSAITTLVTLDLQEKRCNAILADAQNATLTSRAVRDVDATSGVPLCWEDVVHANALRLNEVIDKRRMILRDMELTPEMQTKRKKALGNLKPAGADLASRQSDNADKLRRAMRGEPAVVDI
jgi:hypothetical protein